MKLFIVEGVLQCWVGTWLAPEYSIYCILVLGAICGNASACLALGGRGGAAELEHEDD